MPVPSTIADLSTVAADNSPQGSEPIGTSLDNYIRAGYAFIKQIYNLFPVSVANGGTGATTASAARTNLGLGSSATLTAGTSANNVVQLTAEAILPAVDASLLTGVVVPGSSITPAKLSQPFTAGTSVTASGTAVDFTGIPSWVKRITVMFSGLSANGTSFFQCQIGGSGGIETSSYAGGLLTGGIFSANNTGFIFNNNIAAASGYHGVITLTKLDGNTWIASTSCNATATYGNGAASGAKTLSATLARVRITTVNGTDTFGAGTINIMWE